MLPVMAVGAFGVAGLLVTSEGRNILFGSTPDKKGQPRVMGPADEFCLMLANVIFLIDGDLSAEEASHLKKEYENASESCVQRIDNVLKAPNTFVAIRNWYKALDPVSRTAVAARVQGLVSIDHVRTQEEDAFLVQFAQIADQQDAMSIFVARAEGETKPALLQHDLFRFISNDEFDSKFPSSECRFSAGALYTEHPYVSDALLPLSIEEFERAQEGMYDGLIGVLKELGAKKVLISESTLDDHSETSTGQASAEGTYAGANLSVEGGARRNVEELMKSKQTVEVRFDGSKPSLLNRALEGRWKQSLLKRYRGNKQYTAIISGRFGSNKINYFRFEVKSDEARKLVRGINAAAKFDNKLVKAGASGSYDSSSSTTRTVEKSLVIHFH